VDSVIRHTDEPYEFVFVDNGSTDETVSFFETVADATVILNDENKGFAAGNNQGMAAAKGDYILLLNNDTVVTPEWLNGLLLWLQRDSTIGIVCPVASRSASSSLCISEFRRARCYCKFVAVTKFEHRILFS
jgi:GT2 family glycosyltransferase